MNPAFLIVLSRVRVDSLPDGELHALSSPRRKQKPKTRRALHAEIGRRYVAAQQGVPAHGVFRAEALPEDVAAEQCSLGGNR